MSAGVTMKYGPIDLTRFKAFIFDLDGVVYRGDKVIEGAADTVRFLRHSQRRFLFVTNHTRYTRNALLLKLRHMGIDVEEDLLMTANDAVIRYIGRNRCRAGRVRVNLLGVGGIVEDFLNAGFELTTDDPEYVVVAWDPKIDYEKLYIAARNVREGAAFVVTSPDRYIPSERGFELGFGALGASIAYATGRDPAYIGKPYPAMLDAAVTRLDTKPAETVIVGDTLETDIRSHRVAGLGGSVLVLTGNTTYEDLAGLDDSQKPSLVLESIQELRRRLS